MASLDLLKVFAAMITFLFHCNIHLGINFLFLTPFVSQGAIMMDLFFMLSGFTLYMVYHSCDLQGEKALRFYKKRVLAIYPLYFLIMAAFWLIPDWRGSALQLLTTLPVEVLLMQSWFPGLFSYSHNGGTWFVSCLTFQYLVYPAIQRIAIKTQKRQKMCLLTGCYLLCSIIPFMVMILNLPNAYSNQLLRLIQFFSGVLLAALLSEFHPTQKTVVWVIASLVSCSGLVLLVTALYRVDSLLGQYVSYGFVTFPIFLLLIASCVMTEITASAEIVGNKVIKILADHAYAMFLAQFFIWKPIQIMQEKFSSFFAIHTNWKLLIIATVLLTILTFILQNICNIPMQRAILKRLNRKD